jgi:ribosome recycling factor
MINDIKQDAESRMQKSIEAFKVEISRVRTGRAHPAFLEKVMVDYYGSSTPLNQVANITASDSRMLMVTPWEKTMVQAVEKAILNADLGLNPATSGTSIRVPMPALTEERRKELIKVVRGIAESGRIAIRNIRRDANGTMKELLKEKEISEDDERRGEDLIQKITDKYISVVDTLIKEKEADLVEI